jgi:hypothetical protein
MTAYIDAMAAHLDHEHERILRELARIRIERRIVECAMKRHESSTWEHAPVQSAERPSLLTMRASLELR